MQKRILSIIELVFYISLLFVVGYKYYFLNQDPDNMTCLIILLVSMSMSENRIKSKIKNNE